MKTQKLYYNSRGEEVGEDSNEIYAIYRIDLDSEMFFCPITRMDALYNFEKDDIINPKKKRFELKSVKKSCFEMYLRYLRTRNPIDWKHADRCYITGE